MGIYVIDGQQVKCLTKREFKEIDVKEKEIQDIIKNNLASDKEMLGEPLFVIGEELNLCKETKKRLDLLAIDKKGKVVVIELKRNTDGFHMDLQAIRYASMARLLTIEKLIEYRGKFIQKDKDQVEQEFIDFLGEDYIEKIELNDANVRIMLVNQDFSSEITNCVIWLNEQGLDIQCVKIEPYELNGQILWDVDTIIPVKEVQEYQMTLREKQQSDQETKRQSNKDFSKYTFDGGDKNGYSKGRLVLEIIKQHCKKSEMNLTKLQNDFTRSLQGGFEIAILADNLNEKTEKRFFSNDKIELSGEVIVVTSEWGFDNFQRFITRAKELGYVIERVEK